MNKSLLQCSLEQAQKEAEEKDAEIERLKALITELADFIVALDIAKSVLDKYRVEQYKWWKKLDGTPALNDIAVRMAEAFTQKAREAVGNDQ
jgi:SMC interacting uncharacterized protein involved in chromosome segregation